MVFKASIIIIIYGLLAGMLLKMMGKNELSDGIFAGAGLAWTELCLTALIIQKLFQTSSKKRWAVVLGLKSLGMFLVLAGFIFLIKLNETGILIGFSGLILTAIILPVISKKEWV